MKAKAEPSWRFWGLYVHVCTREPLREAYRMAQANNGAPGIDGVTFEDIEASGGEPFLEQLQDELVTRTYRPMGVRQKAIPQEGGTKVRVLSRPTSRDRVGQGARKLILEPILEADCPPGAYGYRPKRSAHDAVRRGAEALVKYKTHGIAVDLQAYLDNLRHPLLLAQVAQRVHAPDVLHVRKRMRQAAGQKGVAQGAVLSPLRSNL